MKRISLLSILILMSSSLMAQFERTIPQYGYSHFLRTLKGDYVLVYNSADAIALDETGQPIMTFDYDAPVGGYWNAFDLIDTSVVFTGGAFWMEFGGWFGTDFYQWFDAQWEVVNNSYHNHEIEKAEKAPDGGFIGYSPIGPFISRHQNDGQYIWNKYYPNMEIWDVAITSDLTTIAITKQGLQVIDASGDADSLFAGFDYAHIESISFEKIALAKSDSIFLFSNDLQLMQSYQISAGDTVKAMKSMEHKLAVLSASDHVYLFDQDLALISDFQLDEPNLFFKDIVPDVNGVVLAGDHQYGNNGHQNGAIFIKKYGNDGYDPFVKRDVELAYVQVSSEINVWPVGDRFKVKFNDTQFQVTNHSDTVLNSLYINVRFPDLPMEFPMVPNPIPQHFYKKFNNLNLAPGESATLTWEEFTATFLEYPSGTTLDLCFWTSFPDEMTDGDNSNDVACADFFVNTNEPNDIISAQLELAPNPSSGNCLASFSVPTNKSASIQVTNLLGQTIQQHSLNHQATQFQIEGLSPGIYLVTLELQNSVRLTKRLVIQ